MNAAQARRIMRERRMDLRKTEDRDEMAIHADQIMTAYETAYEAYNGKKIRLCYTRGFVRLDAQNMPRDSLGATGVQFKSYRLKELQSLTRELEARAHAANMGESDD